MQSLDQIAIPGGFLPENQLSWKIRNLCLALQAGSGTPHCHILRRPHLSKKPSVGLFVDLELEVSRGSELPPCLSVTGLELSLFVIEPLGLDFSMCSADTACDDWPLSLVCL